MAEGEANGRTWIKVDTDLLLATLVDDKLERSTIDRHRQVAAYLALIAWSRRKLTDGAIPKAQAAGVVTKACGLSRSEAEVTLSDLSMTGMVKTDRHRYLIPDYAEWQQTKADVIALSERQSANARKRRPRQSDDQPVVSQRQASGQQSREEKISPLPQTSDGEEHVPRRSRAAGTSPRQQGTNPRRATKPKLQLAAAERYVNQQRAAFDTADADLVEEVKRAYPLLTPEQITGIIHAATTEKGAQPR